MVEVAGKGKESKLEARAKVNAKTAQLEEAYESSKEGAEEHTSGRR